MGRVSFDVAGRVGLSVDGVDQEAVGKIATAMDPCPPQDHVACPASLTVEYGGEIAECGELINPARDAITTGTAGSGHVLLQPGLRVTLPRHDGPNAVMRVSQGGSITSLMRPVIRPALQILMLDAGAVAIHAACVEVDGEAIAVAGWSETGKTEVALALLECGGRFVSDKWTVVGRDGTAGTFPIGVGVRRWVLDSLPTLRRALPGAARARLGVAASMDVISRPLRHLGGGRIGRTLAGSVGRVIQVADRAGLTPSEVAAAYGHELDATATRPLRTVVMLSTIPAGEVRVDDVTAEWTARRLARTAQYERRDYYDLLERARYGDAGSAPPLRATVERREEEALLAVLDGVRLLKVSLPFPTDPTPVAQAIMARVAS